MSDKKLVLLIATNPSFGFSKIGQFFRDEIITETAKDFEKVLLVHNDRIEVDKLLAENKRFSHVEICTPGEKRSHASELCTRLVRANEPVVCTRLMIQLALQLAPAGYNIKCVGFSARTVFPSERDPVTEKCMKRMREASISCTEHKLAADYLDPASRKKITTACHSWREKLGLTPRLIERRINL